MFERHRCAMEKLINKYYNDMSTVKDRFWKQKTLALSFKLFHDAVFTSAVENIGADGHKTFKNLAQTIDSSTFVLPVGAGHGGTGVIYIADHHAHPQNWAKT